MKDLDPADWIVVDRLFEAAVALPEHEREDFLESCSEPEGLIAAVRQLLALHPAAQGAIGDLAVDGGAEWLEGLGSLDPSPPQFVGPYKVLQELGRGGMGTVYLAKRVEEEYDRVVALKVVKRGMDTDEVLRRFERERRILARLEHPYIARMYDAGSTTEGTPYLVMEYVEGRPIDAYCDERSLGVDERLRLYLKVLEAVSFAHGKLILHRDLKPSNILVTPSGMPKLLDFGIAKVMSGEEAEGTLPLTRLAGRRLTPEYASPEQRSGAPITTASDVYAAGVVLYELLTGQRPTKRDASTRTTVPRPSTAVTEDPLATPDAVPGRTRWERADARGSTPQRLGRRLEGDLDIILVKALHDDPDRRYPSVEALAADLERHLDGYPVTARPDSVAYRMGKFVRRNRIPVASGSGLGAAVLLFLVGSVVQQAQITAERDRAQLERDRAQRVSEVLQDLFTGAGFESGERADTLSLREFISMNGREALAGMEGDPVAAAPLLRILGSAELRFGHLPTADSLMTRAVQVLEPLVAADDAELASARRGLGNLRLAQGRFAEAEVLYRQALLAAKATEDDAVGHHTIALSLHGQGRVVEAIASSDSALLILRSLDSVPRQGLADALTMRGLFARDVGDLVGAVRNTLEAAQLMESELGPNHPKTLLTQHNYAQTLARAGRDEAAEERFRELVPRYREHVGAETPDFATLLRNYGNLLTKTGRPEAARPLVEEALRLDRRLLGAGNPNLSFSMDAYGTLLSTLGLHPEALAVYREGLSLTENGFGGGHPLTGFFASKFAAELCATTDADRFAVLGAFDVADSVLRQAFPPGHPGVHPDWTTHLIRKARCLESIGYADRAEAAATEAVELLGALDDESTLQRAQDLLERIHTAATRRP